MKTDVNEMFLGDQRNRNNPLVDLKIQNEHFLPSIKKKIGQNNWQ